MAKRNGQNQSETASPAQRQKNPPGNKKTVSGRLKSVTKPTAEPKKAPAAEQIKAQVAKPKKAPAAKPSKTSMVKPKKSKKAHATRPTEAEIIEIQERRELILNLRKSGASIRQISDHLKQKGIEHHSPATVHSDLQAELRELRERNRSLIEDIVELELERLDSLQFCLWAATIRKGDTFGVYAILAIMDRRADYLGLKKPRKIEIDTRTALAKLIGADPEELPNDGAAKE